MSNQRQKLRKTIGQITLSMAACWIVLAVSGCGYGTVSESTYEFVTATYSACHAESEGRLQGLQKMLSENEQEGEVPSHEAKWLRQILQKGLDGDWKRARQMARRMLDDQVQR